MGAVANFSYAAFQAQYPTLASVPAPIVQSYWTQAGAFHDNSISGPVRDASLQAVLMNMMTAHIMVVFGAISINTDGSINQGVVGRVSSASEGSVSISTENQYPPGSAQWLQQTAFGSAYYYATEQFRVMQYRAPPRRRFNPPINRGWPGSGC